MVTPAHASGAASKGSTVPGTRPTKAASAGAYSAKQPLTMKPVYLARGHSVSRAETHSSHAPHAHPSQGTATRSPSLEVLHARAQLFDDPDLLVPRDERQRGLDRPVPVRGVDVGVAEPRRFELHEHLATPRVGGRYVFELSGRLKSLMTATFTVASVRRQPTG